MADATWTRGLRGEAPAATPRDKKKPAPTTEKKKPQQLAVGGDFLPSTAAKGVRPMQSLYERDADSSSPTRASSVCSGGDEDFDFSNDSVKVFVRVRPPTAQEAEDDKHEPCVMIKGAREIVLNLKEKGRETQTFKFDAVMPEATQQQEIFELAGQVAVDNCLAGYNSSIFAYGQTGAGKTYTVMGQVNDAAKRGLAPRVFQDLYTKITDEENTKGRDTIKYNCRCSFLEIYNETIGDLLHPASSNLPIREDAEKGPYVEGLSEPNVLNAEEMLGYLARGADNRHTGETRLNRESSRSHSVFTCTVEKTVTSNGVSKIYFARIHLIDLAGSERIASGAHGGSNATGEHFKEACHINKSLTALGRVTTELLKSQKAGGVGHVPYRDSKLTFLLQSSLGGNAKTLIIANISPSSVCAQETLSTLRFVRQTKYIRNDARVNWTVQGDRLALQKEIERLRAEVQSLKTGYTDPLVQLNEDLKEQLREEQQQGERLQQERDKYLNDYKQAVREKARMEAKLAGQDGERASFCHAAAEATRAFEQALAAEVVAREKVQLTAEAEAQLLQMQHATALANEGAKRHAAELAVQRATAEGDAATSMCKELQRQLARLQGEKQQADVDAAALAVTLTATGAQLAAAQAAMVEQAAAMQAHAAASAEELAALSADAAGLRDRLQCTTQDLEAERSAAQQVLGQLSTANQEVAALQLLLEERQADLGQRGASLEAAERQLEGKDRQLEAYAADQQQLQARLSQVQQELEQLQQAASASQEELSGQVVRLAASLSAGEAAAQEQRAAAEGVQQQLTACEVSLAEAEAARVRLDGEVAQLTEQLQAESAGRTASEADAAASQEEAATLQARLADTERERDELAADKARLQEGLEAQTAALAAASTSLGASREEGSALAARVRALEGSLEERCAALEETRASLATAEASASGLAADLGEVRAALEASQAEAAAAHKDAAALRASLAGREQEVAALERELAALQDSREALAAMNTDQSATLAALKQEHRLHAAQREARIEDLEGEKSSLLQLIDEQQAELAGQKQEVASLHAGMSDLHERLLKEEAQRLDAVRATTDKVTALQRQLSAAEGEHGSAVQQLQDELSKAHKDLQHRDAEMVRTNFALKGEINNLADKLERQARELAAVKVAAAAAQEKMKGAYREELATLEERLNTTRDRFSELSKRHDGLKQQLEGQHRETEYWRTKQERLDSALGEVTRLIGFARHPPDSARSSLIMTRSEHMSQGMDATRRTSLLAGSRAQALSLRVNSPASSPKGRYAVGGSAAASPAASKAGSTMGGLHADGDWEVTSRQPSDVRSPGDQLAVPPLDADDA